MIWLIGGTSESVIIAKLITEYKLNCIISVTTDNARNLYESISPAHIFVGKLSGVAILNFLQRYDVTSVIDCSHPFASQISQSVITVCQSLNISYLRFDRPKIQNFSPNYLGTFVPNFESLVDKDSPLEGKTVLLTIGANYLPIFKNYQSSAILYARILPYPKSLSLAYEGGFSCDRIIALRPPITKELEKALWQLWNIEIVVTKAGGKAGGEDIKYQVAKELNVPLIIISRPQINYPVKTSSLRDVKKFIQQLQ